MATFVAVYGGGLEENRLNLDSRDRIDTALKIAGQHPDSIILFGVGPQIPRLAETTIRYLHEQNWPKKRLIHNPKGHNTLTETAAFIEILDKTDTDKVIAVTSWCHIPRVWLIWKFLWRKKERVEFVPSWKTENIPCSLLWEAGGFAKLLKRLITGEVFALRPRT